jgi:hypothetical protein
LGKSAFGGRELDEKGNSMTLLCRAAFAGVVAFAFIGQAAAQQIPSLTELPTFETARPGPMMAPPGPGPQGMPAAPPPGAAAPRGPGGGPAAAQQEPPPCFRDFIPLRDEAQKRGGMIQAAAQKKAPRQEVCQLFKNFEASEAKVIKYVTANQAACQIPNEAVTQMKANHDRTVKTRTHVCSAGPMGAAPGAPPPGPKLSDELGVRGIAGPGTGGTGSGTFNTLSGNALAR